MAKSEDEAPTRPVSPAPPADPVKDPILRLTTHVQDVDTVEVDGEAYDVYGMGNLSDEDEAIVTAALARYDSLSMKLVTTQDDKEAVATARKMRVKRIALLVKLTSIPEAVAAKLALSDQTNLLRAVQKASGVISDDDTESSD